MDSYVAAKLAQVYALQAELYGMVAANQARAACGDSPAYTEDHFTGVRNALEGLSIELLQYVP